MASYNTGYSTTTYEEQTGPNYNSTTITEKVSRGGEIVAHGASRTNSHSLVSSQQPQLAQYGGSQQMFSGAQLQHQQQQHSYGGASGAYQQGGSVMTTTAGGYGGGYSSTQNAVVGHSSQQSGRIISTVNGEARETGETHIIGQRNGEARYTGETRVVEQYQTGAHVVETRVVGIEKGAERQVSVTEIAVGEEIIGERTIATGKGRRGRKIIREEVIEKVIVVPETIQIEEWVEDEYDMEETVVEVAKKYQIEKIVEVPEIEIIEKVVEQIEKIVREKVVEVPVIQTVEKIVEIPVIQTVEKIVEVPEIQYNDIPVERIVEVPEIQHEEVIREVKRANFVDKPIEQKRLIADHQPSRRKLPVPIEAETIVEFTVPHIRANYIKKRFPVYLPRFIEVPVSRQFIEAGAALENDKYNARLKNLTSTSTPVSLCEIERLAAEFKEFEGRHRFNDGKITMGASMDTGTKRSMFSRGGHNIEQFAVYKGLPVEVCDVHLGHYSLGNEGAAMTYSSAAFGGSNVQYAIGGGASSYQQQNYSQHSHGSTAGKMAAAAIPIMMHQGSHSTAAAMAAAAAVPIMKHQGSHSQRAGASGRYY